jgi:predicted RNase H-like nuclease
VEGNRRLRCSACGSKDCNIRIVFSGWVWVWERMLALVTGVDGCKSGWIAITLETESGNLAHTVRHDGTTLFAATSNSRVIAIDIPIGLTEQGVRECDQAARRLLGRPRSSSVFPAPIRPSFVARSREEADRISRSVDGRGVGAQAWNIYSRIREVDSLLRKSERLQDRVYESHPEVCFWGLNGGQPMPCSKHSPEGLEERRRLIDQHFGIGSFQRVRRAYPKSQVSADDILDAFAVCWTTRRIFLGVATTLPEFPSFDRLGLPMRIVY